MCDVLPSLVQLYGLGKVDNTCNYFQRDKQIVNNDRTTHLLLYNVFKLNVLTHTSDAKQF